MNLKEEQYVIALDIVEINITTGFTGDKYMYSHGIDTFLNTCMVLAIFGVWKIIEIIYWLLTHIKIEV